MVGYLAGALAGRVAVLLCAVAIALPYALRRGRFNRGVEKSRKAPYLRRLWPHFWAGYLILALTVLHVGAAMGAMQRASSTGIKAATAAFFLLILEIVLGLTLKEERLVERRGLRRIHFWVMVSLVGTLGMHLWFNG